VETTTLEQAAESLLSTSDAPEAKGDNLSEAVDEITELSDDGRSDEVEATAESEDDIEASDENYDDDQIDDEDLVEAEAEDTNLIPVKVDGNEEMWTLDQLKQSAAGQAAINKRFQEVAEARKHFEQQAAVLAQREQQVIQLYQQAPNGGLQAPIPPSRELFENDPIGYMESKLQYDDAKTDYDQRVYQIQTMQQRQAQMESQAHDSYLQQQAEILRQHIPDIAHPEKGEKLKSDLMNVGMEYGFTAEEMAGVADSRYVRALNDARKYRELVARRKQTQQKGDKARPVVRPGAKRTNDGQSATRKKAQTRLQKTGSINDALNLILDS
jgi:hypothetical protein